MVMLARNFSEAGPKLWWAMKRRLLLLEELARDPDAFRARVPDLEEAKKRLHLAMEKMDRKAEKTAFVDVTRAELWQWWLGFGERNLLTLLCRRRARPDFSRKDDRPTHCEASRLANALAANAPDADWFSFDWEASAVAAVLKDLYISPIGDLCPDRLREYIELSQGIPVYHDALHLIREEYESRNEPVPPPLAWWQEEVDSGRLPRPPEIKWPNNRPAQPHTAVRDILAQFLLHLLGMLGLPPKGVPLTGIEVVAAALGIGYDRVELNWKHRIEKGPFDYIAVKPAKGIALRNGLHRSNGIHGRNGFHRGRHKPRKPRKRRRK